MTPVLDEGHTKQILERLVGFDTQNPPGREIECAHYILKHLLDMGCREELEGILEQLPESRASHLMSATFPGAVVSLANRYQKSVLKIEGTRLGVANADIRHIIRRKASFSIAPKRNSPFTVRDTRRE